MRDRPRRVLAIAAFTAVFSLGLYLDTNEAAAQATPVLCANTNFGTVVLDNQFAPIGPLTFAISGTCIVTLVIQRDDVTLTTNGAAAATLMAADPNQPTIRVDGSRRFVIDGLFTSGFTVSGGTYGISVRRGSSADIRNCHVTGASNTGIISTYNSDVTVDGCSVDGNMTNGVAATNTAALVITNSTVSGNVPAGNGILAARNSYVRVGQDQGGNPVAKPVTVSGNGATGIVITEGSAGTIVGGTVQTSGSNNIFVGRASSAQIGLGVNNLTGGVTVQGATSNGIVIEGGNATIVFSTITANGTRGITISNAGSARIGVTNFNNVFGKNFITNNHTDGIGVFHNGSAFIGENDIVGNTNFGINTNAMVNLVGGAMISGNGQTGVFVRAGQALIGDPGFGAPSSVNTISGNGINPPPGGSTGGIFAFQNSTIQAENAVISNNTGTAVQAFEAGVIELRGTTAVTVPAGGATVGALVQYDSTLRLRDTASIISATSDGVQATNTTSVNLRDPTALIQGNGAGKVGVLCFNTNPLVVSAATLTGNLTGVTGAAGASSGCNVFP